MFMAAGLGTVADVMEALSAGASPNARTGYGFTPLHRAAAHNTDPAVVAVLLGAGADPNMHTENGKTPLHMAARNDNPRITPALLLVSCV